MQRLTDSPYQQLPASWHPSGKFLAFFQLNPQTQYDLMILPMEGDETSGWKPGNPSVFLNSPFIEQQPMFSPDGRWLAYISNESGQSQVYMRPFPGPGSQWQISANGGADPVWSRTRRELFFSSPDLQFMVVPYSVDGDSFRADKPHVWSTGRHALRNRTIPATFFDLHPDGERFAVAAAADAQAESKQNKVTFIFNFFDELRRVAPAARR